MRKIEREFNSYNPKEISIAVNDMSYLTIYGRHINGWYLCMPGRNVSCELGNPAESSNWNLNSLVNAFQAVGYELELAGDIAAEILKAIYDYENRKKKCS